MWYELHPLERILIWNFNIAVRIFLLVASLFFILKVNIYFGIFLLIFTIVNFKRYFKAQKEILHEEGTPEEFLDFKSRKILLKTLNEAEILKTLDVDKIFLNLALKEKYIKNILARAGIESKEFSKLINGYEKEIEGEIKNSFKKILVQNIKSILNKSYLEALNLGMNYIPFGILFIKFLEYDPELVKKIKINLQVDEEILFSAFLIEEFGKKIRVKEKYQITKNIFVKPKKTSFVNRAWTSRPTPLLDSMSEDLTFVASLGKIGYIVGHKNEIELTLAVLEKPQNNNVILLGEVGSGKTTILYHLAWLIKSDKVPKNLFDKRLVLLNLNLLLEKEEEVIARINKIIYEINRAKNIILAMPDDPRTEKIIEHFKDLVISQTPLIVLASPENYKNLSKHPYVVDTFTVVRVGSLSEKETLTLLTFELITWEIKFKIKVTIKALKTAIKLANRFLKPRLLPGSARELMLETINIAKIKNLKIVDENLVAETLSQLINIPVKPPELEETQLLLNLEEIIHQSLIDQQEAVKEVSEALRTYRAGLGKTKGPIGVFLFLGPTGVGKTELAKTIAKIYFNGVMTRLDMGQFQEVNTIDNLIGSESTSGILTESVKRKPYSVLLLDEFEKCHPKIWDIFLAIFDEGKIQDFTGREIDFSNTIIIATSNAFSEIVYQKIRENKTYEEIKSQIKEKLYTIFPPELLNRFDGIIIFKPLSKEDIKSITNLKLKDLKEKINKIGYEIEIKEAAIEKIIEEGYSEVFGARALERTIQERIYDVLSKKILANEFTKGKKIIVDFQNEWKFYQI